MNPVLARLLRAVAIESVNLVREGALAGRRKRRFTPDPDELPDELPAVCARCGLELREHPGGRPCRL